MFYNLVDYTQTDLAVDLLGLQRLLLVAHPEAEGGHERAVAEVTEHHREQERERYYSVRRCGRDQHVVVC